MEPAIIHQPVTLILNGEKRRVDIPEKLIAEGHLLFDNLLDLFEIQFRSVNLLEYPKIVELESWNILR